MELIGKKITRTSAFETSTNSTLTVSKGKLKLSGAAMRKVGLFKKEIGIGYDGSNAYLYVEDEGAGNKVHDNGSVNTSYHSKALLETFNLTGDNVEFSLMTDGIEMDAFPDKTFFQILPIAIIEAPIAVRSEADNDDTVEYEDEENNTNEEVSIEEL